MSILKMSSCNEPNAAYGAFTLSDTDTDTNNDKFYTIHFVGLYISLFVGQCEHTITTSWSLWFYLFASNGAHPFTEITTL